MLIFDPCSAVKLTAKKGRVSEYRVALVVCNKILLRLILLFRCLPKSGDMAE